MADTYDAVHQRLRRERGAARNHDCTAPGCDQRAAVWAWQRTGPSRVTVRQGDRVRWGVNLEDYAPMCASHAAMLDCGGTLTHCPRGHLRAEVGVTRFGRCRGCHQAGSLKRGVRHLTCPSCGKSMSEKNIARHRAVMHKEKSL